MHGRKPQPVMTSHLVLRRGIGSCSRGSRPSTAREGCRMGDWAGWRHRSQVGIVADHPTRQMSKEGRVQATWIEHPVGCEPVACQVSPKGTAAAIQSSWSEENVTSLPTASRMSDAIQLPWGSAVRTTGVRLSSVTLPKARAMLVLLPVRQDGVHWRFLKRQLANLAFTNTALFHLLLDVRLPEAHVFPRSRIPAENLGLRLLAAIAGMPAATAEILRGASGGRLLGRFKPDFEMPSKPSSLPLTHGLTDSLSKKGLPA